MPESAKEAFMEIAWADFIRFAFDEPEIRKAFERETGQKFIPPARNAFEAAVDDATGVHEQQAEAFVLWATDRLWGRDEAPERVREALEEKETT